MYVKHRISKKIMPVVTIALNSMDNLDEIYNAKCIENFRTLKSSNAIVPCNMDTCPLSAGLSQNVLLLQKSSSYLS